MQIAALLPDMKIDSQRSGDGAWSERGLPGGNSRVATVNRQPRGVPVGGQFANKTNPESDVELAASDLGISDAVANVAVAAASASAKKYGGLWGLDPDTIAGETIVKFVAAVSNAGGYVPDKPDAYCARVARTIAIRQRYATRTEVRNATVAYNDATAALMQRYGRLLTADEEDAIAEKIRSEQPLGRTAPPGFHRPVQVVPNDPHPYEGMRPAEKMDLVPDDYIPVRSTEPPSGPVRDQVEDLLQEGQITKASRLAYSVLAEQNGAPMPMVDAIIERRATNARKAVREAGGVMKLVEQWEKGDGSGGSMLFTPFGDLDASGKRAVVTILSSHPHFADDLWGGALTLSTIPRPSILRSAVPA